MSSAAWRNLAIGVLLIGLLIAAFLTFYEQHSKTVNFGYSPEARLNDYLAARRFLNAMGIPAHDQAVPTPDAELPPPGDVLLLPTKRLTLDHATNQVLLDWTRSGGHLVVSARTATTVDGLGDMFEELFAPETGPDALLGTLGLLLEDLDLDADERAEYGPFDVDFSAADDFIAVDFDPDYRLFINDEVAPAADFESLAGDDGGSVFATATLGGGRISVIADRKPLHNRNIGDQQHALFLWHLVNMDRAPAAVWIVSDDDMPALPMWLWGHAREFIISLALLLALSLWAASRRFGPLQAVKPPLRRSVTEHIRANGEFLWSYDHHDREFKHLQQRVHDAMVIKYPATRNLDSSAAAHHLAAHIDMAEADIRHALTPPPRTAQPNGRVQRASRNSGAKRATATDFTRRVALLHVLRKQL